jgi:hypothetical protein
MADVVEIKPRLTFIRRRKHLIRERTIAVCDKYGPEKAREMYPTIVAGVNKELMAERLNHGRGSRNGTHEGFRFEEI